MEGRGVGCGWAFFLTYARRRATRCPLVADTHTHRMALSASDLACENCMSKRARKSSTVAPLLPVVAAVELGAGEAADAPNSSSSPCRDWDWDWDWDWAAAPAPPVCLGMRSTRRRWMLSLGYSPLAVRIACSCCVRREERGRG